MESKNDIVISTIDCQMVYAEYGASKNRPKNASWHGKGSLNFFFTGIGTELWGLGLDYGGWGLDYGGWGLDYSGWGLDYGGLGPGQWGLGPGL